MALPVAVNQETGETVVLVGNEWKPAERVAQNAKGEKAYLVGGSWISDAPPAPTAPSAGERIQAGAGGIQRGMLGLAGLPVDAITGVLNSMEGFGAVKDGGMVGKRQISIPQINKPVGGSEWLIEKARNLGINVDNPQPTDPASRMAHTAGTIVGGSLVPGARPVPAATSAAGGAVAGEVAGPAYVPVGAMTPAAAAQAGANVRNAVANRVAPNVATFKEAGVTPSVGQSTQSNFFQALESLLAKFPGGQSVMRQFQEFQARKLGQNTATGTSAEDAGRAIDKGVKGFLGTTRAEWQRLDDALGAKVSPQAKFQPTNTRQAFEELVKPIQGAEKTSAALANPKIREIAASFADDLAKNGGQMPFESLRALRSRVGAMVDDALVTGIPGGEVKKLYGALSKDLEAAANASGAGREFARQNNYYAARMDRVEDVLERVIGKGRLPEDIFRAFMPRDPDAANKVRAVMRSLDDSERQIVAEAVVSRLGRATPGKQSAEGDVFSSETFLSNWNRLSDGAKAQLFPDDKMRRNLDAVAKVAGNIRQGSQVFANPSGTGGVSAGLALGGSGAGAAILGEPTVAVAAGSLIAGANVSARLLTNPQFVELLSKSTKYQANPMLIAQFGVLFNQLPDEASKQDLTKFIQSIKR